MKNVNDKISIKTLDELKAEGIIPNESREEYHITSPIVWDLVASDSIIGKVGVKIVEVDSEDPKVPYKVTGGIWVPEFMVKDYVPVVIDGSTITAPTVTRAEGARVKYGNVFKFLIALEKEIRGSRVIWQANINRLSKLSPELIDYIQKLLKAKYPEYEIVSSNVYEHIVLAINEYATED